MCRLSGVAGAPIGVIHEGKVVHTPNYGFTNVEKQITATSDTVYGIGSVTNSFVDAALAKLVDEKKLD